MRSETLYTVELAYRLAVASTEPDFHVMLFDTWQGGDALERAHAVTTVIFDKTGTLTQGCMVVASVQLFQTALTTDQVRTVT